MNEFLNFFLVFALIFAIISFKVHAHICGRDNIVRFLIDFVNCAKNFRLVALVLILKSPLL